MSDDNVEAPLVRPLLAIAIVAPALLSVYPVQLALEGMAFGPAAWVSIAWQLASVVIWAILAVLVLTRLRHRTTSNHVVGLPPLSMERDGGLLLRLFVGAVAAHAVVISLASTALLMGRGRPILPSLIPQVALMYGPGSALTMIGLITVAIVAAEHRARLVEADAQELLQQELANVRLEMADALRELNDPVRVANQTKPSEPVLERIGVLIGNRTVMVDTNDIDWIEAESYYARIHVGPRTYLVRQTMNALESRLDPRRFARIHRSTIVNLDRVDEVRPLDRRSYVVVLRDGRKLTMSRRRRQLLDLFTA